jgi:hypothetical protein
LLRQGAIEVSRLPYNSPIFCVAKKKLPNVEEGDPVPLRVMLDYRGVNARSMPDRYSIKEVRECIDETGRSDSDRYSCIDLTSGFWQMELEEESRQYTAFSVPGKAARFHWCVAPMGLQGSPASFARLMDYVMGGDSGRANVYRRRVGAQQRAGGPLEDGGEGAVEAEKIRTKAKCG